MTPLYERETRAISTLAHLRFYPLALSGGSGSWVVDGDGRQLLDFAASWGAVSLGHSDPRVGAAVTGAFQNQAGASYLSSANMPTITLAERLLSLAPRRAAGRVWFGHSGSDANETVARAVRAATGRDKIISFKGAYHGGTAGSAAVSGHPSQAMTKDPGLSLVSYPNVFVQGDRAGEEALAEIDRLFETEIRPNDVAAFFIEPIQSDGGLLVPPPGFFREIESRCRAHGILLISDEVKVGLGRTGRFHAFSHHEIEPDIIVLGKALGGGLPISAVIGPEAVMNHASAFSFQTLHGNPICAAAAQAVLDAIEKDALVENAHGVGNYLLEQLNGLKGRHPLIGDVRGQGLAVGLELVSDHISKTPARRETAMTVYRAFERGLVLFYVGVHSNVIEFTPPLTLTREEVDLGIAILDEALHDVENGRFDETLLSSFSGW